MKAILIDPITREVREVLIEERHNDAGITDLRNHIVCTSFDTVRITRTDHIFVDDVGRLQEEPGPGFAWEGYPEPLAGRGVILGHDPSGEPADASLSLEEVRERVRWIDDVPQLVGIGW